MTELNHVIEQAQQATMTDAWKKLAISCLDLTCLNASDTEDDIRELCQRAVTPMGKVAAVCIAPEFVNFVKREAVGPSIKIATVANFPSGAESPIDVLENIKDALFDGANEIDLVLPYEKYLAGDTTSAISLVEKAKTLCGNKILKVILETGALSDPDIIAAASRDCLHAGANFLKTSTGKIATGATLEAAAVMLHAIKEYQQDTDRRVGFKASGGVRTADDAAHYITLAELIMGESWIGPKTFRLGASSLLDALLA